MKSELILINLTSLVVLIVSYLLFRRAAGSMSIWKINMLSFIFYVFLFFMSFIGSVLVVNKLDNHYLIQKLHGDEARFYGWAAVMYTMISLPVGMLFAKQVYSFKPASGILQRYRQKKIETLVSIKDSYVRISLYALCSLSILSILYTIYYTADVPIVGLLKGIDINSLSQQRISSGRGFSGNEYFKNIFGLGLTPILAMIAFSYYKMTRSAKDKLWFYSMLLFTMLILTYDLQKSPLVTFIIGIVMLQVMTQEKLNKLLIVGYASVSAILLLIAYALLSENFTSETLFSYNTGIFGRVFLSGIAGLFHSFEIFPARIDFLGFSTMSVYISDLFGLEYQERSARLIMEVINPHGVEGGIAGVVNSLFVAEAWANFGVIGVILGPFYVGFLIGLLYYFFLMAKKTPVYLGLYGYFSYKGTIVGGFNDYLYNAGVLIIMLILLSVVVTGKRIYDFKNDNRQGRPA